MKYIEPCIDEDKDKWLRAIDIIQNKLKLDVYPGGYSAVTGWYHRHDAILKPTVESLYGSEVDKIPDSILKGAWERKFYLFETDYFPKNLGVNRIKTRDYILRIPALERGLLEMVYNINIRLSIDTVFNYFSDLHYVDPKLFQRLLETCTSEKIKRIGLFLADESCFDYYDKINLNNIKLDLTKNIDLASDDVFPNHVAKYNIEVPGHLNWIKCKHEPYYKGRQLSKRAI